MEILHLIQNSLSDAILLGGTIISKPHLEDPGFKNMLRSRAEQETVSLISHYTSEKQLRSDLESVGATRLFLGGVSVRQWRRYEGAIMRLVDDYDVVVVMDGADNLEKQYAALTDSVPVGIPMLAFDDGWSRFKWIYDTVKARKWNLRGSHWLFGISNPAELAIYPQKFTNAIHHTLTGLVTSSCYIDSGFGVRYSTGIGNVSERVIESEPSPYRCSQQSTLFELNNHMISDFVAGRGGGDLIRLFEDRLQGG